MKSIIEKEPVHCCFLCGAWGPLEKHHIFGGNPNRKWSEKYGLTVHLCPTCHRDNKKGVHGNADLADKLHKMGQAAFERKHSRKKFYEIFGRYYLDFEEKEDHTQTEEEARAEAEADNTGRFARQDNRLYRPGPML